MPFHELHRQRFLQRAQDPNFLTLLETVAAYGVRHEPAAVGAGQVYWRAIGVHHLSPDENRGKHVIFVDVVDENGRRVRDSNLRLVWGWEGQRADEHAGPKAFDKGEHEPAGNVDLYPGQHTWVRIEGDGLPSDRILNLHSSHPDEPAPGGEKWTTYGHHSFYVVFQRTRSAVTTGSEDGEITTPVHPPSPPQEELTMITFGPFSHQDLINAFAGAAASLGLSDNWALLTRCGMRVEELAADRTARYQGTALHLLPNLTVTEKNLLMRQLAHVLATRPVPPRTEPAPPVTPQPEPPPSPARLGNRLGYYLHSSQDQHGLWDAITRGRPPAILIHADTANTMLLEEIRHFRAPDAFVIGRMYKDVYTQRQMLESGDPAAQGRAMADEILNYNFGLATRRGQNGRLLIDAWMSLNEAVPGPASRQFAEQPAETSRLLRNYDQFQVAFRQRLQEAGVEAVAFNFGAGNFSAPEHYLEFFPGVLGSYIYLGFHEYGWPTLYPDAGSATSAGLYRRCLAGIRARYGDRHRVIITEAGLTRMHQNPQWGDVGWLNSDAPLREEEYWRSLAWYNDHLNQDGYVIGACLFEVGHYGGWESFRHLGADNHGQPIHLIDRLVALNDAAAPRPMATPAPTPAMVRRPITIGGAVTRQGKPVVGATVRLFGTQETLGTIHRAAVATTSVTWTRQVRGLTGALRQVWSKQVAGKVAGLTWEEFKVLAGVYNSTLTMTDRRSQPTLKRTKTYFLPENRQEASVVVWDRPLTGFAGSLWTCWQQHVENKVIGLTYADFKQTVGRYNPTLAEDGNRFLAEKRYNLPRNQGQHEYALFTQTGKRGRFRFADLPPGPYRLEVTAEGALPQVLDLTVEEDMDLEVTLQPLVAPPASPPSPRAEAPRGVVAPSAQAAGLDFVRTHGNEFISGGMPLRFIGVNIRGLVHYGDGRILAHSTDGHRYEQVAAARDMGARVIRVFLPSEHTNPQETAERLRSLVALVQQEAPNLYILPALCNLYRDVPFRIQGDDGFYQRLDPNFHAELLNADFFTGGFRRNYLPFVQHIVQAFRDEAQIFAWEIGNELKLNPATGAPAGDPNVAAFIHFMLTVAQEIRQLDPNHLITTGMISTHHAWLHNEELRHRLYRSPLFDFLTVHCYNDEYHNDDSALAHALHKPFIIEEAGYSNHFGPDRSGKTAEDMRRWFGLGARGYMPWGFMATTNDMGDGDGDSGLDRALHQDWDSLFNLYRSRAAELAQVDPHWRPVVTPPPAPPTPPAPGNFSQGTQVYTQDWVNIRKSPGHQNKLGDDVLGTLAPGAAATITGAAVNADGLTWWPVRGTLPDGRPVDGWAAESVGGNRLLGAAPPPPQTPRLAASPHGTRTHAPRTPRRARRTPAAGIPSPAAQAETPAARAGEFSPGQQAFATAYVNLRQDPGYLNKPGDHVIGTIPPGAPLAILDGPIHADGLTWWAVRGPLLDNRVASGWAATVDPNGQRLLGTAPPLPPQPAPTGVHGQPFRVNDTVVVVAQAANIRHSAGYLNRPPEHVVATVLKGATFTITGGPQMVDVLEWWQVSGLDNAGQPLAGWMAQTAPDGRRLLATTATAGAIRIARPFPQHVPLTQGWGARPDVYGAIPYDGVFLKGHNGLDFGTRIGTPILAIDAGVVIKVDFEEKGFGNHIIVRHAWGESLYAHLESVTVGKDVQVSAGQQVGLAGETGFCEGAHLHFGIRIFPYRRTDGWGGFVDPTPFMNPGDLVVSRSAAHLPSPMAPELPGRPRS